jgi:hypothetical protein
MSDSESLDDATESVSLGNSDDIDHFVLVENLVNGYFFFKQTLGEVYFSSSVSSVNLDFNDVVFFLSEV